MPEYLALNSQLLDLDLDHFSIYLYLYISIYTIYISVFIHIYISIYLYPYVCTYSYNVSFSPLKTALSDPRASTSRKEMLASICGLRQEAY